MGSCSAAWPDVASSLSAGSASTARNRVGSTISSSRVFGVGKSTWNSSMRVS